MPEAAATDPRVRSAIVWLLLEEGFARSDAEAWADGCDPTPGPLSVAAEAVAYDDYGIELAEAVAWNAEGYSHHEALILHDAGWTPGASAEVSNLLERLRHTSGETIDDWVATGLPPARVAEYLRAGVHTRETGVFEALEENASDTLYAMAALLTEPPPATRDRDRGRGGRPVTNEAGSPARTRP